MRSHGILGVTGTYRYDTQKMAMPIMWVAIISIIIMICLTSRKSSNMTEESKADQARGWNYKALSCALVVAFILQVISLPCLCCAGHVKLTIAFTFDALMLLRMLIAGLRKEKGRVWIFYLILIYTSVVWVELLSRMLFRYF